MNDDLFPPLVQVRGLGLVVVDRLPKHFQCRCGEFRLADVVAAASKA